MRTVISLLLLLAFSLPQGASAQTGANDSRESRGAGNDGRDSNDSGTTWPPRRVKKVPPPRETVIIVPAPNTTSTRRTKPKPPKRVPRTSPSKAALTESIDLAHSLRTPMNRGDVRLLANGDPEFIAIGPQAESTDAVNALIGAGATFVRQRPYPTLGLRALVFDPQDLSLAEIRQILAAAAPTTKVDTHAIYRLAAGAPRLYAAALVNPPDSPTCTLSTDVRIGQIDGPVAPDHDALRNTALVDHSVLGKDTPPPRKDHGTAVAALLIGQDDTGALAGFATGAHLFAASAFGAEGASGASDIERIAAALDWLAEQKVQLINLSFAGPVNTVLNEALKTTAAQGITLIAAAGNGGIDTAVYPAAADSVIGVTAIDAALRRYASANTGAHIEFAAPGVDVYVATEDGGNYASGTSYSAPILTGLAARLVAQGVTGTDMLRSELQRHSVDLGDSGRDSAFGWGLVKELGC